MSTAPDRGDDGLDLDTEIAIQAMLAARPDDPLVLDPRTEEQLHALLEQPPR